MDAALCGLAGLHIISISRRCLKAGLHRGAQVAGVIETTRPDAKNAQYQSAIKHGDLLLNRLQKLSKVIDDTF